MGGGEGGMFYKLKEDVIKLSFCQYKRDNKYIKFTCIKYLAKEKENEINKSSENKRGTCLYKELTSFIREFQGSPLVVKGIIHW